MTSDTSAQEPNPALFAEATGWLVDFREGYVDSGGERRFYAWLRRSPEHIRAYMEVAALWADIPRLASDMVIDVDHLVAQARAQNRVTQLKGVNAEEDTAPRELHIATNRTLGRWPLLRPHWALAAVVVVASLVGLLAWWQLGRGSLYATGIGEQRSIALADGSMIELGARSRVRVRLGQRERDVELLSGQALFRVAKDPSRPFIVVTNNAQVRAVGTEFDVHKRTTGTTVTVLEGRVAVYATSDHSSSGSSEPQWPEIAQNEKGLNISSPKKGTTNRATENRTEGPAVVASGAAGAHTSTVTDSLSARTHPRTPMFLGAGEQMTVGESGETPLPHPLRTEAAGGAAWSERTLTFEDAPLSDVVEEFNRYNERQIVLSDPALQVLRISGVFAADKPSSLLHFLSNEMQLEVKSTEGRTTISPKTKNN